jgi:antagonist of KipI
MSILVEVPGLLTTLQDLGRRGCQHLGVGPSGVMDEVSHRLGNLLVGNPEAEATLEITLAGPRLRFEADALIALCGGDLSPELEGRPVPLWRPVLVRAGARLQFGRPLAGARCYLAVAGGFQAPRVMNSASTNLAAGFGGFQGRPLKRGDRLETADCPRDLYPGLQDHCQRERLAWKALDWFAPWFRETDFVRPATLHVVEGPQWQDLTPASRRDFLATPFMVAPNSDRMGIRLRGEQLILARPLEMLSAGVAMGTIQLPPDGAPILLMADRQTTGGYPRLGEVATVDLPKAAQLAPGETLRFKTITLEAAQDLLVRREARFKDLGPILKDRQRR